MSAPTTPPPQIPGLVLVQPLGSGGYADVYLYEQQSPRMNVAVKVLKGDGLTPALTAQFTAEANAMAQLADHPYIVQVFRADVSADGRPYFVMKYYPPPNLAVRSRRAQLSTEEALRTGIQLASAVETAHRAGIVHRDIKPANVLVSQYGVPGLTDFGIAGRGLAGDDEDDLGVSVPWAAPEVLFGQSAGDVRSDIYSLAATVWQLLAGRSPFEVPGGDNSAYALLPRIRATPVPSTGRGDVPVSLERLLALAMAKDPALRPGSALAFARALQAVEQEQRYPRTPLVLLGDQGAGSSPDVDDDATVLRPVSTVGAQAGTSEPVVAAARPPAETPTAARVAEAQADRPETAPDGGRPTRWWLLAAVGALVLGLATWWGMHGSPGLGDQAGRTSTPPAGPTEVAVVSPEVATLDGRPVAGGIRFTWTQPDATGGDRFRIRLAAARTGLPQASWTAVAERSVTVSLPAGTQRCGQVQVLRQGVGSAWSAVVCERAG